MHGLCQSSGILKNTTVRKLDPFPSSGEGVGYTYFVGSARKSPHLRTETDPVSEALCFVEYRTMDKVQKPSNSEC
jgi:hypothetical protein